MLFLRNRQCLDRGHTLWALVPMAVLLTRLSVRDSTSPFMFHEFHRMKRSILLLLIAAISTLRCNSNQDHIDLHTGQKFRIQDGEKVTEDKSDIISQYNIFFNSYRNVQIPLFKFIKHDDYEMFIGIPVSIRTSELFQRISEEPNNRNLIFDKQNNNSYLMKYEKENHLIVTYLSVLKDNSIICFSVMADDSKLIDDFFRNNTLKNRLYE